MNRINKLLAIIGKSPIDDWFMRNKPLPEFEGEVMDKVYEKSDLVYICIRTTATAISQVPLLVGKKLPDGKWEPLPSEDPWQKRFETPGPYLNRYSFVESIVSWILLDGESFIIPWPPRAPDENEATWIPAAFYVIPAKSMNPIKAPDTNQLIGWIYSVPGSGARLPFRAMDICHTFLWNPFDPIRGFAPIRAGKISVVTDYKAAKFNQGFFDRGATFSGVLETEQRLGDSQYVRLKSEIDQYKGYKKAWDMFILEQGLKFHTINPTHKDMLFPELRMLDKEKILQIFGMKKAVISVTDDLNYATAKEQRKSWWQDTNIPIMKLILAAFNFQFFEHQNLECRFDFSTIEALQEDFSKKVDVGRKLWEMGYTANEINTRLELGFEEAPHRDKPYIAAMVQSIDESTGDINDNPIEPPPSDDHAPVAEDIISIEDTKRTTPLLPAPISLEVIGSKSWTTVNNKVAPTEEKFQKKVTRAFFEWRVKVIEWLYSQGNKSVKATEDPFILTRPNRDLETLAEKPFRRLKTEADALYREAFLAGLETIALELGIAYSAVDILAEEEVIEYLSDKVIRLVGKDGIQKAVSTRLNRELLRGMAEKETVEEIASRLKQQFKFAANRAKTIARTEIFSAMNRGRDRLMSESDFKKKVWWTCLDERVRTSHREMHGKQTNIGKSWRLPDGSILAFPGDPDGPAAEVINCRCIETVAFDSYQSPEE